MRPDQFEYVTDSGVRALLIGALETGDNGWVNNLAFPLDSNDATEDLAWLGTPPALREFVGGRQAKELAEYKFSISSKDYEGSLRMPKKSWIRDKSGQLQLRINQFASRVNDHPAKILSALIINGESSVCYDGQYFFDTDHVSKNSGSQSNDITSTAAGGASTPTAADYSKAIMGSIQQMYGLKDDEGEPTNQMATAFDIMVPVSHMGSAIEATTSLLGTNGGTNLLPSLQAQRKFSFNVIPNPRLSWTTKFATFRSDGITKPFVLMTDEQMRDVFALGPTSEYCRVNGHCLAGVDWSGNVQYGDWTQAVLTTFQ